MQSQTDRITNLP